MFWHFQNLKSKCIGIKWILPYDLSPTLAPSPSTNVLLCCNNSGRFKKSKLNYGAEFQMDSFQRFSSSISTLSSAVQFWDKNWLPSGLHLIILLCESFSQLWYKIADKMVLANISPSSAQQGWVISTSRRHDFMGRLSNSKWDQQF